MNITTDQITGNDNKQYTQTDAPKGNDKGPNNGTPNTKTDEIKPGKKLDADPVSSDGKPKSND